MRLFYTIDGNPAKPDNIIGYCKHHHGVITHSIECHKKCRAKECHHFIEFEYENIFENHSKHHPTGDAYREGLKRKHGR